MITAIIVLCVAVAVLAAVLVIRKDKNKDNDDKFTPTIDSDSGEIGTGSNYSGGQQGIRIPGYPSITVDAGKDNVTMNLFNPEGNPCYFTFKDLSDRPVFDPGYPIIDANILFDDASGKTYLYYSRCCYKHAVESEVSAWAKTKGWFDEIEESWIYGVELKPDFSGVIGEPVALLCPPKTMDDPQAKWENRSVTTHEVNRRWTEGSYMVKHGNLYYMLYSANFFGGKNYAVGYATSQSPLGPFTKAANNPVLQKNTEQGGIVTGTGHCMLIDIHNRLYCVYHGRTETTGDERMVFIDLIDIQPDGKLVVHGPNTDLQKITY